jgi:OmpA-OmpF porin, OOP family
MKRILPLCAALALASLSAPAFADDSAIFVRAELGNSTTYLGDLENLEDDYDDSDFSYNLHAGYFFNGNLGAEAFYGNYGEGTDIGVKTKAAAYGVGVIGKMNFGGQAHQGFYISGRAGIARAKVTLTPSRSAKVSESDTAPYIGFGAGYDFNPKFGIGGTFEYLKADVFGTDANIISGGVAFEYRF